MPVNLFILVPHSKASGSSSVLAVLATIHNSGTAQARLLSGRSSSVNKGGLCTLLICWVTKDSRPQGNSGAFSPLLSISLCC